MKYLIALLISIILAQAKLQSKEGGPPPLLLLDEIAAHLDKERRETLFYFLSELGVQTWFTGTESTTFSNVSNSAQVFEVNESVINYS